MSLVRKLSSYTLQSSRFCNWSRQVSATHRLFSTDGTTSDKNVSNDEPENSAKGGFARAFERYTAPAEPEVEPVDNQSFASLLRNSKFIDVGSLWIFQFMFM